MEVALKYRPDLIIAEGNTLPILYVVKFFIFYR